MGDVIPLRVQTTLDISPELILEAAASNKYQQLLIIGYLEDGTLTMNLSMGSGGQALWLLERAKELLMSEPDKFSPMTNKPA